MLNNKGTNYQKSLQGGCYGKVKEKIIVVSEYHIYKIIVVRPSVRYGRSAETI